MKRLQCTHTDSGAYIVINVKPLLPTSALDQIKTTGAPGEEVTKEEETPSPGLECLWRARSVGDETKTDKEKRSNDGDP